MIFRRSIDSVIHCICGNYGQCCCAFSTGRSCLACVTGLPKRKKKLINIQCLSVPFLPQYHVAESRSGRTVQLGSIYPPLLTFFFIHLFTYFITLSCIYIYVIYIYIYLQSHYNCSYTCSITLLYFPLFLKIYNLTEQRLTTIMDII